MNGIVTQYWSIIPGGIYTKFHMSQSLGLTDLMYCQYKNAAVQIGIVLHTEIQVHVGTRI